jgi:hypothetical protein
MRRYADSYIDQLIARSDYDAMVDLQGILMSGHGVNFDMPEYGLPSIAFVFVESILWFAQSVRSGAWTYFESISPERQSAMYQALESFAPKGFAERYKFGSENWKDPEQMERLDRWIDETDPACIEWLAAFQRKNRSSFWPLYA